MRKRECPFFIAKIPHIDVIFMQTQVNFSYFYGEESEQFSYFRIPRLLVRSKKFKTLSTDAKLLYGLIHPKVMFRFSSIIRSRFLVLSGCSRSRRI